MWNWVLIVILTIIIFTFFEELIYYAVNRSVFGPSRLGQKIISSLKLLISKLKIKMKERSVQS